MSVFRGFGSGYPIVICKLIYTDGRNDIQPAVTRLRIKRYFYPGIGNTRLGTHYFRYRK